MSTHWIRIEILWLHQGWGREEIYYRRTKGTAREWSKEELAILLENYETMSKLQLMMLLPKRGWEAISKCGNVQGLSRPMGRRKGEGFGREFTDSDSYSDLEFRRKENIDKYATRTNWRKLSVP